MKSGLTDGDNGRWAQTGVERDRYRFKTPGLRNVALTYPYYHDGSIMTLSEAIDKMARFQVGRTISALSQQEGGELPQCPHRTVQGCDPYQCQRSCNRGNS